MSYAEETYQAIMGHPPAAPAVERTSTERRESLEKFFTIMESMTDDELAQNPLKERPLNISILKEHHHADANAA